MRRIVWVIVILLGLQCVAPGQEYPMLHMTTDDGLPSNTVYQIYRSSKGFLWFATDRGVARYNGLKFERFTTFDGLPDNEIFFFQEDTRHRLWLGTFNGAFCYYQNDTFHTAANTPSLKSPIKLSHIRTISVCEDSSIMFSFGNNLDFINLVDDSMVIIPNAETDWRSTRDILKTSRNRYDILTSYKRITVDNKGAVIGACYLEDSIRRQPYALTQSQGQYYYVGDEGIYTRDFKLVRRFPKEMDRSVVNQVYIDGNTCFFSTTRGLYINDTNRIVLKGLNVASITQDDRGNYWICTLGDGVYVLSKDFAKMKVVPDIYKGVAKYAFSDSTRLFFTNSENNLYELKNDKLSLLFDYKKFFGTKYRLSTVLAFLINSDYSYFNFCGQQFVYIPNITSPKLDVRTAYAATFQGDHKTIHVVGNTVYAQKVPGISTFDVTKITKDNIPYVFYGDTCADHERVFCSAKAPHNSVWFATIQTMYRIDSNGVLKIVNLKNVVFKTFLFSGRYIVGYTHDNKCVIVNLAVDKIFIDSLPQQSAVWEKLHALDSNHVLLSTNGLYRILTLYPSDGPPRVSLDVIENSFVPLQPEIITSDGKNCYFFKNGNIETVTISSLLKKNAPPKLFFTSLKTKTRSLPVESGMEIPYADAHSITLPFTAISFAGKDIIYQYSVSKDGNGNWRNIKAEELNLINPGFGVYTIKLRAKTKSSDFCKPVELTFSILRPYWATWWFVMLDVLVLVLIIALAYRYRMILVLRRKEKEHGTEIKFMKSEYKALNALMNPHFIFNTLNNVQSLVNENKKLAANQYLRTFADLIRQNMQNVSHDLITLQKEIDLVANYLSLEKLRFEEKLTYIIEVDKEVDTDEILIPPLLIQPLVENSIKHGILPLRAGNGVVKVCVCEKEATLYIIVKDNGVGLQRAQQRQDALHNSFGLQNIKRRVEQLSIIQNKKITFSLTETADDNGLPWTIAEIAMELNVKTRQVMTRR